MEQDALTVLGFPAIAERLAGATGTDRGRELAHSLTPSADRDEIERRQALTAEAVALLDTAAEPPLAGIHDVREPVELAARGGVLTPGALHGIEDTIGGGLRLRAVLDEA